MAACLICRAAASNPFQTSNHGSPSTLHSDFRRKSSTNSSSSFSSPEPSPPRNVSEIRDHAFHPSSRLRGTTCMITGGSSGIGFAIAQRFLREGAGKIILVGRSKERLIEAWERLRAEYESATLSSEERIAGGEPLSLSVSDNYEILDSGPFRLVVGDVGDPLFWSEEVKKTMDNVDILINAAGISRSALLPMAKDEHIAQVIRTNLQGTIFACRAMTRRALQKRRKSTPRSASNTDDVVPTKCIINISSLHAIKGGIGASTYASTKAGVIALTRAIAAEGSLSASGAAVRANVIVPGYIDTKMLDEFSDSFRAEAERSVPLRRFGTCEEVADAAAFLATNQYANNCVLNLDGGLSAM
ncbi:hypothetical protein VTO42DRAFT_2931 [Malbranchea cinnamomea]